MSATGLPSEWNGLADDFCWANWDGTSAFTILGMGVGQQTVIFGAILTALALLLWWRVKTHDHKYNAWTGVQL